MRENPKHLAWIDLETTGSHISSEILEVGLAITDATPELGILDQQSWTVYPAEDAKLLSMDEVVTNMHIKSGLLGDLLTMKYPKFSIKQADRAVWEALKPYLENGKIPLAGSGVAHFDMRFIEKYMPETFRVLNYAPYDVGSMRRWFRLAGIQNDIDDGKTHRALDDVLTHAKEAREYMRFLRKGDE
jgi:oligoribonuclease